MTLVRRGLLVSVFVASTVTAGVMGAVIGRNTAPAPPPEPVGSLSPSGAQDIKHQLDLAKAELSQLKNQIKAAKAYQTAQANQAALDAKIARAEELVKKLGKQYENYLEALAGAPRIFASFGWPLVRA